MATLPTNRQPGDVIASADLNAIAAEVNAKQAAIPVYADEAAVMTALGNSEIAVGDIVAIENPPA